jgi:hypothetical protein
MGQKLRFFIILAAVMAVAQPRVAQATNPGGSGESGSLRIEGAKVSTETEAKKLAVDAYFKKTGGLRGVQTAKVVSIHRLDVEITGFARKGDRVWEVRIYGPRDLRAVIWIHSASAKTYFLVPRE